MEELLTVIGAFAGGGAFKSIVDYFISKHKTKNKDSFEKLFEDIHEIYSILNTIKRETYAKRILLVRAQNGGGVPTIDSELTSTIIYETYDYPFTSVKEQWQEQHLNDSHLMILREMYIKGETVVETATIPNGNLKDALVSNEVDHAVLYLVVGTEKNLYYISLQYTKKYSKEATAKERNVIRTSINKLKDILISNNKI